MVSADVSVEGGGRDRPADSQPAGAVQRKRAYAPLVMGSSLALALAAWGAYYVTHRHQEWTDNAQLEGHIVNLAPRVAGRVRQVLVRDNQQVQAGDVLVELESEELELRVRAAQAELDLAGAAVAQARAQLGLTRQVSHASALQAKAEVEGALTRRQASNYSVSAAEAEVMAAQARKVFESQELERCSRLLGTGAISLAQCQAIRAEYDAASAAADGAAARRLDAHSSIAGSISGVAAAQARLREAEAGAQQVAAVEAASLMSEARFALAENSLKLARLNLSYALVKAPIDGVVARRTVEPGQVVAPERPLLALVGRDVWIVANFKEDQSARIKEGMPARVELDAHGLPLSGHVESLAPASGARFSLLPPDNASGNFVKVVQRVPVLIRLDDVPAVPLRPGLSASVSIDTRNR